MRDGVVVSFVFFGRRGRVRTGAGRGARVRPEAELQYPPLRRTAGSPAILVPCLVGASGNSW